MEEKQVVLGEERHYGSSDSCSNQTLCRFDFVDFALS